MMDKKFLEKYINGTSAVSYECLNGQKIWADYVTNFANKVYDDNYGSIIAEYIGPSSNKDFKVLLDAHGDEISWMVNYIDDKGNIFVKRNGGSDCQIAPSKNIIIHTKTGEQIKGVFGWLAIHVRKEDKKIGENDLWVDVGATSKEEVEKMGIVIGDIIVFDETFRILNNNKFVGKSLDDKIGGFINSQVLKKLRQNNIQLPYALYVVNTVQEEIGLRGAQMITQNIKPNVVIAVDPIHETTSPGMEQKDNGDIKFGNGIVFTHTPSVHRGFLNFMVDIAKEKEFKFQTILSPRSSGTNTDSYAYSNGGVISNLISIPLKYMHTTVEMVQESDVNDAIELIYETLLRIKNNHDFRYLKL